MTTKRICFDVTIKIKPKLSPQLSHYLGLLWLHRLDGVYTVCMGLYMGFPIAWFMCWLADIFLYHYRGEMGPLKKR